MTIVLMPIKNRAGYTVDHTQVDAELAVLLYRDDWTIIGKGYVGATLRGKHIYLHRELWELSTGAPPEGIIDHIDGRKRNNLIENLRDTTYSANAQNRNCVGAHWESKQQRWVTGIKVNGRYIYLGSFVDRDEALAIRRQAELTYFGDFARK